MTDPDTESAVSFTRSLLHSGQTLDRLHSPDVSDTRFYSDGTTQGTHTYNTFTVIFSDKIFITRIYKSGPPHCRVQSQANC